MALVAGLSVSSNGSWCVQQRISLLPPGSSGLSVSSNGSWCVQPSWTSTLSANSGTFQYPRTDRGVCNFAMALIADGEASLSVSSNGSWCVQLLIAMFVWQAIYSFSILERIVVCATLQEFEKGARVSNFQYPRTDRGVCNKVTRLVVAVLLAFQYPRTDRGVCNNFGAARRRR